MRDLLAAEPRDTSAGALGQAGLGGADPVAACPEEGTEFWKVHRSMVSRAPGPIQGAAPPGSAQPWQPTPDRPIVEARQGGGAAAARPASTTGASTTSRRKEQPMPFANFKVPEKTLTPRQKKEIVTRTTELYVEIYGERARSTTLVLVEEVADGGWGVSGDVLTLAALGGAAPADTGDA